MGRTKRSNLGTQSEVRQYESPYDTNTATYISSIQVVQAH